jgi:cytochrome c oxidase subunit 4
MAIKFFMILLVFMHLKFDHKLFSLMFYIGLVLAIGVYMVALFTFKFFAS